MHPPASREAVGFLCRWALLGGAGLFLLLVGAAGVSATARAHRSVGARLAACDWVTAPAPDPAKARILRAALSTPPPAHWLDFGLAVVEGRPLTVARSYRGGWVYRLANPQPGTTHIRLAGIPYGEEAFLRDRCRLVCVPAHRPVALLDARPLVAADPANRRRWAGVLAALGAVGQVALFHVGTPEGFLRARAALDDAGIDEPLLFLDRHPKPGQVVQVASRLLGRGDRGRGLRTVTPDRPLAEALAERGFSVVLLGPPARPADLPPAVDWRPGPEALKDILRP